ncbi:casein kinase I-like protein [Leishmania infantum JPCM5]|uniref:non-specific serine/threonine protein kinase n=2 Tax=Leishmania infantum TaxID=5671 RepID=A4I2Y4_LEIIN|nr:casein kinase I-like protein [Leishmania infantum JPCM5]CAC9500182.1 casein_kinase_I-like_protein [Leishmania infantum]CAM69136.1 casein kinase I-like protein [Leishmania infantum JPCM5]SUZ43074.1 casein_kinase_I-like_protein [Leishmania infantum]|eukprot:XP_001466417.1 casein kinase I-like protein [Leishmania infantum JPCM5]
MTLTSRTAQAAHAQNDVAAQRPPPPLYPSMNVGVSAVHTHQNRPCHPYDSQPAWQHPQLGTAPPAVIAGASLAPEQQEQAPQPQQPQQTHQQGRSNQPQSIFGGRFTLLDRLGSGGFGEVYRAEERDQLVPIAVKVERVTDTNALPEQSFLFHEAKVMQEIHKSIQAYMAAQQQHQLMLLQQEKARSGNGRRAENEAAAAADETRQEKVGIAKLKYYGQDGMSRVLIMSLHGQSVANVHRHQGRLSLFATVMIADQVLRSLEHVHRAGYVHADLKPDNILFGREDPEQLYLVDFGLSVHFRDRKGKHRPLITNHSFVGTPRYASLRTHMGHTLSRRDDIEQLVYVMIYLFRGRLPWSGLRISDPDAKEKRIAQMKAEMTLDSICAGCPEAFRDVLNYARCMEFEEEPQYQFLHVLLCSLRDSCTELSSDPNGVPANGSGGVMPQMLTLNANCSTRQHPKAQNGGDAVANGGAVCMTAAEAGLVKNTNIASGVVEQIDGVAENPMMMSSRGTGAPAFFSDAIGQGFLSGNGTDAGPLSPRIDCLNGQPFSPPPLDLQRPCGSPQLRQMR